MLGIFIFVLVHYVLQRCLGLKCSDPVLGTPRLFCLLFKSGGSPGKIGSFPSSRSINFCSTGVRLVISLESGWCSGWTERIGSRWRCVCCWKSNDLNYVQTKLLVSHSIKILEKDTNTTIYDLNYFVWIRIVQFKDSCNFTNRNQTQPRF